MECNPILGIRGLITKPAPKSRITQRKGRAGRKFRGVFYPLYPMHIYEKLPDQQLAQILYDDISPIMLDIIDGQLKAKSLTGDRDPQFSIADIDMVDVPSPDALAACMEKLYTIGFVTMKAPKWSIDTDEMLGADSSGEGHDRFGITQLGVLACMFSMVAPESIRMIFAAYYWDCSVLDVITIAAYLSLDNRNFAETNNIDGTTGSKKPAAINWLAVYKHGLPGFLTSKSTLYKIRLLIADDFIHGIILFNAIKYVIASVETKASINTLRAWCAQNGLSYKACIDLIRARNEIIDQLIAAGLDAFVNESYALARSDEGSIMNIITKLKHCIYDGYRNNLLIRSGPDYKTAAGVRVVSPSLFKEDEKRLAEGKEYGFVTKVLPNVLIYRELSLKYNRKTSIYDVIVDRVSTCDGFVSIDPDFAI